MLPLPSRGQRGRAPVVVGLALIGLAHVAAAPAPDFDTGFAAIAEEGILADLQVLTSPAAEGRDSPSTGLAFAADHLSARLAAMGYEGAGEQGSFLMPFGRSLPAPAEDACYLEAIADDGAKQSFELGGDFVPVLAAGGQATGEAVFVGFGIDSAKQRYDDVPGDLKGQVAVILESEPRHDRRFEGPDVTEAADLYRKLDDLLSAQAEGVLVVRRPPPVPEAPKRSRGRRGRDAEPPPPPEPARLGYRYTWADWAGQAPHRPQPVEAPVMEVTADVASAILGFDVLEAAATIEEKVKEPRPRRTRVVVTMEARTRTADVRVDNVVGRLAGGDPALADEWVVLGAHYDHLGVDPRGRIAYGADDNASGTAALLAVAEALALARPPRSVLICFFAAEEDGLLGSKALADKPPIARDDMVAMLNMDMVGRGKAKEVAVLGTDQNPHLDKLLKRAKKLEKSGVTKIVTGQGQELFQRSDHYSFHEKGVPALFFFEGLPISANEDYHTWRDTLDEIDLDKVARTSRLVFNTAWLLATEDDRPPPPDP